ncbi:MAG: hypothetical protein QM703_30010 [Gemmatales bacterium]
MPTLRAKYTLILPLVMLLGSVAMCAAPLVWPVWKAKRWLIKMILAAMVSVPLLIMVLPEDVGGKHWIERAMFLLGGILFWGTLLLYVKRLDWRGTQPSDQAFPVDRFLLLWLVVELAGYFATTPFLAVRRIVGIYTASVFILGRVAYSSERRSTPEPNCGWIWKYVLVRNMLLALIYTGIDWLEANAVRQAVTLATLYMDQSGKAGQRWYVGHWGLQYHAESFGMQSIVPGKTVLHAGDWVIIPESGYDQQRMRTDVPDLELVHTISLEDALPLRTMPYFYWGSYPLVKSTKPRLQVMLYRVKREYLTETGQDPHGR